MRKLKSLLVLMLVGFNLLAQSELTLPLFENVFQSSYLKPTVRPEHTISIGLPGISSVYAQGINNGFLPKPVTYWENDTLRLDPALIPNELLKRNMIFANADVDLFHLRLRIYNWDYWVGVRQRHSLSFFYPKDLISMAIEGNASRVGETLDFSSLGFNVSLFREYTFGMATELDKWVIGGRISFLQGLSNAYLKPQMMEGFIDDDMFGHSITANAVLRTAGLPLDEDFVPKDSLFSNKDWLIGYFSRFRNPGAALSFGVTYNLDQRTSFSISVNDIGFIHWSDSTRNVRVKENFSFDGIDGLADFLYSGEFLKGRFYRDGEFDVDSAFNTLMKYLQDEEYEEVYTTWLSPKFYVTANYKLARRTNIGFQFYGIINRNFYPAFSVGLTQGFGRTLNLAFTGSFNQRTLTNVGFGLMVKPGPVQIYLMADNLYSPLVDPLTFTNLNLRAGVNLVFGRVKTQQGLPYR